MCLSGSGLSSTWPTVNSEQVNEQSNYQMICEDEVMEMTTDLQK